MNVREEDRQKNSCPSRGLGLAAAAIGVGVGAALYYFFSKRPENPGGEGSTTGEWSCEQPHAFDPLHEHTEETDSYTTISENSTTDTSMNSETDESYYESGDSSESDNSHSDVDSEQNVPFWISYTTDSDQDSNTSSDVYETNDSLSPNTIENHLNQVNDTLETGYLTVPTINASIIGSDSDSMEWDVTNSSIGVPDGSTSPRSPLMSLFSNLGALLSPSPVVGGARRRISTEDEQMAILRDQALSEEEQIKILREQAYRERTWSLEECSICFDVILKDQEVTTLPCTHNFHAECITPWLREQQTCPNCRKAAE